MVKLKDNDKPTKDKSQPASNLQILRPYYSRQISADSTFSP